MKIIRWLMVVPVFLVVAYVVQVAALFIGAQFSTLEQAEAWQFIEQNDMGGNWFFGTLYIIWGRVCSLVAATFIALKVAPSNERKVGFVIFGAVLLFSLVGGVIVQHSEIGSLSFSFWYRSFVDLAAILVGISGGIYLFSRRQQAQKSESGNSMSARQVLDIIASNEERDDIQSDDRSWVWILIGYAGMLPIGAYLVSIEFSFLFSKSVLLGIAGIIVFPMTGILVPLYMGFSEGHWIAAILTLIGIVWVYGCGYLLERQSEIKAFQTSGSDTSESDN